MSASFKGFRFRLFEGLFCLVTVSVLAASAGFGAQQTENIASPRIVALDPGHGGRDTGAHGPENLLEKQLVLKFSTLLSEQLQKSYKVLLTRTDDYNVALEDRIAKANHARADVFISIHTGASLLHNIGGISIFYYEKPPVADLKGENAVPVETPQLESWDVVKPEQIDQSKYLAELVKKRLLENHIQGNLIVAGIPLFIAVGTEMPTILIEIGFITNPGDVEMLTNSEKLQACVHSIAQAVDDFFSDKLRL
jgi:N-acetylmuramoyl-L-alanine amidase